jgi:PAS domain S-box-containing protein
MIAAVRDYAIYLLSPQGNVVTWNAGAERIKRYVADEIVGQHFSRFYTPEDRADGLPQRALQLALDDGKFESEGWRVRKDGTRFWAHVVIDPLYDDAGNPLGFAKITRDITEQRNARERQAKSRASCCGCSSRRRALSASSAGPSTCMNCRMKRTIGSRSTRTLSASRCASPCQNWKDRVSLNCWTRFSKPESRMSDGRCRWQ